MKLFRYFMILLITLVVVAIVVAGQYYFMGFGKKPKDYLIISKTNDKYELAKINQKAIAMKEFEIGKPFNKHFIFLVDMKIPSGKNRFFVYDTQKDSIIKNGLVAHGSGNRNFSLSPVFSNAPESGCTALGKYKIGRSYTGRFGKAYKLHGLDSSNSNSFNRNIVLHSFSCVPDHETYPYPICNSLGCPMVAPAFLKELEPMIDTSKEPILLWVFN